MQQFRLFLAFLFINNFFAQNSFEGRKFEQLGPMLRSPNVYRTASGAPGHKYWQQKADYIIDVEIDDKNQILYGKETITYTNNSPDELRYLWIQLDQNVREKNSISHKMSPSTLPKKGISYKGGGRYGTSIDRLSGYPDYDGGHKIQSVTDKNGNSLKYTINWTMMRVDLSKPLKKGESFTLKIEWNYNINDRMRLGGRGGFEYFPKEKNYLYTIAQWFPRMAVYSDFEGWQNKQFTGRGEFALVFGDYKVNITVPADHIIAATGVLQNPKDVLTPEQLARFEKAKTADKPVKIVTKKEAIKNEKSRSSKKKTWIYKAENVRDFAFGSSRKYIWDAMGVKIDGRDDIIMAMSYYPKEAYELYEKFSTEVTAHTIKTYSDFTIPYPYPVAISVEAANGMEYPMICFNYGRPAEDGTYPEWLKYGAIGVIIHEVGHNFFPMIINSDERQWTWMDEGLNTFVQFLTEQKWDKNYPSRRGPAWSIVPYMKGEKSGMVPIMTNSEQLKQFVNNAYSKPTAALNILRETVMGRELFDYAFKEYARRWAFKHPTPEDFFRTMEDASGIDLDWFWKGWFYTTDHVDIAIKNVKWRQLDTKNPDIESKIRRKKWKDKKKHISQGKNKAENWEAYLDKKPYLKDFYDEWDRFEPTKRNYAEHKRLRKSLSNEAKDFLDDEKQLYQITFENIGGLVMPIIIEFTFEDGSKKVEKLPAEIWRHNEKEVNKVFILDKPVVQFRVDPYRETADTNESNNYFPKKLIPTRFEIFSKKGGSRGERASKNNPMSRAQKK
jgi:hypothetical protein